MAWLFHHVGARVYDGSMMEPGHGPGVDADADFEFERKFLVRELPDDVAEHASTQVIIQAYTFAQDGYAVRVRVRFPDAFVPFDEFDDAADFRGGYERRALARMLGAGCPASASVAVKSPVVSAERYEKEMEIDTDVAVQILRRSVDLVLKNRFSLWIDEDGWEFDAFGGQNAGLIIAEVERRAPVVDLKIPDFCATEVSDDLRFTNDHLSKDPWMQWGAAYMEELDARGPHFLDLRTPQQREREGEEA